MLNFYVTINPQDGVCETQLVDLEEVFYFPEFRDDSLTATEKRRQSWNKIIRDHISQQLKEATKPEDIKFSRKVQAARINVPWKNSLANEIQFLVASYSISPERWILETLLDVLKKADADLTYQPPMKYMALHKLITNKKEFSDGDAVRAVKECEMLWPEITTLKLDPIEMIKLKEALRLSGTTLEYRLIRAFVVEFIRRLREGASDLSETVVSTRSHVRLQIGGDLPETASISNNQFIAFISSLSKHIRELISYSKRHTDALKDYLGNQAVGESLNAIWETFARSPDVDSALLWAIQSHRFDVTQMAGKDGDVQGKLESLANLLERLRAGMKGEGSVRGVSQKIFLRYIPASL
ncbi:MAG: hypothetical protein M1816_002883 [Peltula sp. TS41687]|nr:MAG: hypothetical protein M1816_002883 [Peltula sp. TS41687]